MVANSRRGPGDRASSRAEVSRHAAITNGSSEANAAIETPIVTSPIDSGASGPDHAPPPYAMGAPAPSNTTA